MIALWKSSTSVYINHGQKSNLNRDGGSWLIGLNLEMLSGFKPCMMIVHVGCQRL
uniref:Uncharacterized protein n=1 Tax=Medicago truncatula TaxID=3880 RepID=I3S407_MEDTR|nr:unknown [Medicago truncatula]